MNDSNIHAIRDGLATFLNPCEQNISILIYQKFQILYLLKSLMEFLGANFCQILQQQQNSPEEKNSKNFMFKKNIFEKKNEKFF